MSQPASSSPQGLVHVLGLEPHPEGGWFRRIWESPDRDETGRASGSAALFLLDEGDRSHWHRIDAEERWQLLSGGPLVVSISPDGVGEQVHRLEQDGDTDVVVPPDAWQSAEPDGGMALAVVSVTPAFVWERFELAEPCWSPGART